MPKEVRTIAARQANSAPYPTPTQESPRKAAIWNTADDETLLQARAASLDWKSIARQHFPDKTSNACRKRHERLIERRQAEDWDSEKLENLAHEYMVVREEMWKVLAARVGEKWSVVEAKCMEKGFKNLQAAARSSQRKASSHSPIRAYDEPSAATDCNRDSGIEFGSDAEMEVDSVVGGYTKRVSSSWHATTTPQAPTYQEHTRSHSLPQLLPLYQPPPPPPAVNTHQRRTLDGPMMTSPATMGYSGRATVFQRYSPESQSVRGPISIQSMLSPAEPQRV